MLVKDIMVKESEAVTFGEWDPIINVVDAVMDKKIGCVVILNDKKKPIGIVTKTDLVKAYKQGISLHQKVGVIMATNIKTILPNTATDNAAKMLQRNFIHHALVVNDEGHFMGLISSWDIASEVAEESRAWPWNRGAIATH